MYGQNAQEAKWKSCMGYTILQLGQAVGSLYVREAFDEAAKGTVSAYVNVRLIICAHACACVRGLLGCACALVGMHMVVCVWCLYTCVCEYLCACVCFLCVRHVGSVFHFAI